MNTEIKPHWPLNRYYDCGFGVNKAEALRQDLITDVALLWMQTAESPTDTELFDEIVDRLECLANLAHATAYKNKKRKHEH